MKNIKKYIIGIITIGSLNNLMAQESLGKRITFSGSVDAYFRTNLNSTNKAGIDGSIPSTAFADLPGFALGMANIIASYEDEKVGFVVDLVYGPRGEEATFNSPFLRPNGSSNIINQLYAFWKMSDKVKLTMGNFNTYFGYEVISPTKNFNYSTSYMFTNGPFSHTGLKADFTLSDDLTLMLAIVNITDFTEFNPEGNYTFATQLGYKSQYLTTHSGKQFGADKSTFQIDYTGGFNASKGFFVGINTTYNNTDGSGFYGMALYPKFTISETFSVGLRSEYFVTRLDYNEDKKIFANTLSANIKINDLTIIPELRLDSGSGDYFVDKNLNPQKNLSSFVLATVYKF